MIPTSVGLIDANGNPLTTVGGQLQTRLYDANGSPLGASPLGSDGQGPGPSLNVANFGFAFNGATWDRVYNNNKSLILASAARTSLVFTPIQTNYNARGVVLRLSITAAPNTAETLTIAALYINAAGNPFSGEINPGNIANAISPPGTSLQTGTSAFLLAIYPGIGAAPDAASKNASIVVPREFGVFVNPSAASSWTYELEALYVR